MWEVEMRIGSEGTPNIWTCRDWRGTLLFWGSPTCEVRLVCEETRGWNNDVRIRKGTNMAILKLMRVRCNRRLHLEIRSLILPSAVRRKYLVVSSARRCAFSARLPERVQVWTPDSCCIPRPGTLRKFKHNPALNNKTNVETKPPQWQTSRLISTRHLDAEPRQDLAGVI